VPSLYAACVGAAESERKKGLETGRNRPRQEGGSRFAGGDRGVGRARERKGGAMRAARRRHWQSAAGTWKSNSPDVCNLPRYANVSVQRASLPVNLCAKVDMWRFMLSSCSI
jgi:hypothetical protein